MAFEAELKRYKAPPQTNEEIESLQVEIEQLLADEAAALEELKSAESARLTVDSQLTSLREEALALEQEEERFWSQYSSHTLTLAKLEEDKSSLSMAVAHDKELLERLKATNVYTDAFCIGHSGGIATMNGLRLGRLPGQTVEWNEINAAWGQTALLLSVLARKLDLSFRGYKLIPKGSFSLIYHYPSNPSTDTEEGEKAVYELYGSGDWKLGQLLQGRRFDHAQVAFLACLKQVLEKAGRMDAEFQAPHAINRDRIGEASIRLQFGSDEGWTRALRCVLVCCNRLLGWVVERERRDVA